MRPHPTSGRLSTVDGIPISGVDLRLELVAEDELTLTAEAAAVLARIVRERVNPTQSTPAPAARRHTGAAH